MRSRDDFLDSKKCSACKGEAFRHVIEDLGDRSYFALQGMEVVDPAEGQAQVMESYMVLSVYICTRCRHVDLYSTLSRK